MYGVNVIETKYYEYLGVKIDKRYRTLGNFGNFILPKIRTEVGRKTLALQRTSIYNQLLKEKQSLLILKTKCNDFNFD